MNAICECGLCDGDGRLHYDEDIASARDDHYYTFKVRARPVQAFQLIG